MPAAPGRSPPAELRSQGRPRASQASGLGQLFAGQCGHLPVAGELRQRKLGGFQSSSSPVLFHGKHFLGCCLSLEQLFLLRLRLEKAREFVPRAFPSTSSQHCPHRCLFLFSSETSPLNEVVSEAFVRFFVEIVGHYSLFLTPTEREERTLQRDAFRKSVSSKSLRRFLEVFMETQMFGGFIQERELRKQGVRGEGLCLGSAVVEALLLLLRELGDAHQLPAPRLEAAASVQGCWVGGGGPTSAG